MTPQPGKEKAKNKTLPTQVAHYHLGRGKFPQSMKPQTKNYLIDLNRVLHQAAPQTISTIIAYIPTHWDDAHEAIELYVFGRFRSHYRVIDKLANLLAETYVKHAILPRINPVTSAEWTDTVKYNGTVKKNIQTNGLVIYEYCK